MNINKIKVICAFLCLIVVGHATTITVNVPGSLTNLLSISDKVSITNLTILGNIDARDIKCLRDEFTKLIVLDISSITIQPYTGVGGTTSDLIYPANQIPDYSFNNSGNGKTSLISITLPDSITTIGNYAFSNCSGLTKIIIPKQVTLIGIHAFFSSGTQGRSIAEGLVFENRLSSH